MRYFGIESHIVLYWMGGLAIPGAPRENAWAPQAWRPARRSGQWDQVLILLAGPGAGCVFALLVAILLIVGGGSFGFRPAFPWFWEFTLPPAVARGNANLEQVVDAIFMFNFIWGLLNLVPVFPLDGGQISRELFVMSDPWRGFEKSLILSLSVALLMAVWAMMTRQQFTFFLFLSLAFSSYTALQQVRR
jgi:Zn-dependent protease